MDALLAELEQKREKAREAASKEQLERTYSNRGRLYRPRERLAGLAVTL